jgi:3-oxoacyl-(acyl-carrier-protein) synthase
MSKIIIKHASMITGSGDTVEANIEAMTGSFSAARMRLENFPAHKYLKDKRVVKVVGDGDRYGLAAVELLSGAMSAAGDVTRDPYRTGLFVGITAASPFCNQNYFEPMRAAGSDRAFGAAYTMAHPTTLLTGLPNNVLCYGSIILDAKGPNSNYTAAETSGHQALMAAASQVGNGLIDVGVAGGVSSNKNPVFEGMMKLNDLLADGQSPAPGASGTVFADGAVFLSVSRSENPAGATELVNWSRAGGSANVFSEFEASGQIQAGAIRRCLAEAGVSSHDIGAVFVTGSGISLLDANEQAAVASVFGGSDVSVVATSRVTGNLMEAGGLFELPFFAAAVSRGGFPDSVRISGRFDPAEKPFALVLRTSIYGDVTCLLIRQHT